jgi:AraC-like DNA-binding protein
MPEAQERPADATEALMRARPLAAAPQWAINEYVCRAGPDDRPFEERHLRMNVAFVTAGSFNYRADRGEALLAAGSVLLGNDGACFECGHRHGRGDRCVTLHVDTDCFAEIASSAAGTAGYRFPTPVLPARPDLIPPASEIEALAAQPEPLPRDEAVPRLLEAVIAALGAGPARPARPSARDARRLSEAIRHIEEQADRPLGLDELAGLARMSKYHFLRTFRHVIGLTPYQFLLQLRLRRAAVRLASTAEPVAAIAYDVGFGDLSTFNNRFRAVFGESPLAYRRRQSG